MKKIIFVFYILFLFGCAHQTTVPVIINAATYQQQLTTLPDWQLEGKIAIKQNGKSDSASITWQQQGDHFDIRISGPLGTGTTSLTGTPAHVTIRNSKEHTTSTDDPQQLIQQHLDWSLPLQQLPQWIIGYSKSNNVQFNADNTIANFNEHKWRVEYLRYQPVGKWLLPEKIVLKHEQTQATILIKNWHLD